MKILYSSKFFLPQRSIFYHVPEKPEQITKFFEEKGVSSTGAETPDTQARKQAERLLTGAIRQIDAQQELDQTKNYRSSEAARGFVEHWLYKVFPADIKDQFQSEIQWLKRQFETELYDATHEIISSPDGTYVVSRPDDKDKFRKVIEGFINRYNDSMARIQKRIRIARLAPAIEEIKGIPENATTTSLKAQEFVLAAINQLPDDFLSYRLIQFRRGKDIGVGVTTPDLIRASTGHERMGLLEKFKVFFNEETKQVNARMASIKEWAGKNPLKLPNIPLPVRPPSAPAITATDGAMMAGENEGDQPLASAPPAAPATPTVQSTPAIARRPTESPVEADYKATLRLLKIPYGTGHGIGGVNLAIDDLKQTVGLDRNFDLTKKANRKIFVAKVEKFQRKVGTKPDGRFGKDTYEAAQQYAGKNKDSDEGRVIASALKFELEAPAPAPAADAVAAALAPAPAATSTPPEILGKKVTKIATAKGSNVRYRTQLTEGAALTYALKQGDKIAVLAERPIGDAQRVLIKTTEGPKEVYITIQALSDGTSFEFTDNTEDVKTILATWNQVTSVTARS